MSTVGTEYDRISVTTGENTVDHYFKDTTARNMLSGITNIDKMKFVSEDGERTAELYLNEEGVIGTKLLTGSITRKYLNDELVGPIESDEVTKIRASAFYVTSRTIGKISFPNALSVGRYGLAISRIDSVYLPLVTSLEDYAFYGNKANDIYIPNVKTIGEYCFASTSFSSISIPNATFINLKAFSGNKVLASISLPAVASTGWGVFEHCTGLETVIIPKVTFLQSSMFNGCTNLVHVSIQKVSSIANNAFKGCSKLESISLPGATEVTKTNIQYTSFQNCTSLADIYVPFSSTDQIASNAPWGATNATIHYNTTFDEDGNPIV